MDYRVRDIRERDREAWGSLWDGYLAFHEQELTDTVTEATWRRLLDDDPDFGGFLAVDDDDQPVGLVHFVVHASTWDTRPVGYLEDLFVDPAHRGQSVGRSLVQRVIDMGRNRGWSDVYWMTASDNTPARELYRSLAKETDWVRYEVDLGDAAG